MIAHLQVSPPARLVIRQLTPAPFSLTASGRAASVPYLRQADPQPLTSSSTVSSAHEIFEHQTRSLKPSSSCLFSNSRISSDETEFQCGLIFSFTLNQKKTYFP